MKLSPWVWAVLGLLCYLIFLIAYLPASYVTAAVEEQSAGDIKFANVRGTLFDGSASAIEASGFVVNNLNWSLKPLSLLIGRANVDVKGGAIRNAEQIYINGSASVSVLSPEHFRLSDAQILVPAKTVLSQVPLPVPVTANGRFRLDIDTLEMTPSCQALQATGAWLNAVVDTPQEPVSLGSFEASLLCENQSLVVNIAPGNRLNLSARLLIDKTGQYEASGQFKPESDLPRVIQEAVNFFPFEQNAQGFYIIEL